MGIWIHTKRFEVNHGSGVLVFAPFLLSLLFSAIASKAEGEHVLCPAISPASLSSYSTDINRFFQAETIKAVALLLFTLLEMLLSPLAPLYFHFYYWSAPLFLGNTWNLQTACTKLDAEVLRPGKNLWAKSWQGIFPICFLCLSHDHTRSFFECNFCSEFHVISVLYLLISCRSRTCGIGSAPQTRQT